MVATARTIRGPRWVHALRSADQFGDDLGVIGTWVGPRTGQDKRDQGQKDDYVLRRLLVAWKEASSLRFPVEVSATFDEAGAPDFLLVRPDDSLGVEVTEAGEQSYQAWLTAKGSATKSVPLEADTDRTAQEIRRAITRKVEKYDAGGYRGPPACDLVVYDNTAWGGFLNKELLLDRLGRPNDLLDRFRQVHFVSREIVFLDIFGDRRRVDVGHLYEIDYANWVHDQVERLRKKSPDGLDWTNVAEELESLGRSEKRALASHLRVLLTHLLKWGHQPDRRSASWRMSIRNARRGASESLAEMHSQRSVVSEIIGKEYAHARADAADETGLPQDRFPQTCPYDLTQLPDPELPPDLNSEGAVQ